MDWVYHVEHVLCKGCIPASFSVVRKDKEYDREHGPLVVKAKVAVEGTSRVVRKIRYERMRQQDKAPDAYSRALKGLTVMEEPDDESDGKHVESAFKDKADQCSEDGDKNARAFVLMLFQIIQAPYQYKHGCEGKKDIVALCEGMKAVISRGMVDTYGGYD